MSWQVAIKKIAFLKIICNLALLQKTDDLNNIHGRNIRDLILEAEDIPFLAFSFLCFCYVNLHAVTALQTGKIIAPELFCYILVNETNNSQLELPWLQFSSLD